jgi:hypothetical protein
MARPRLIEPARPRQRSCARLHPSRTRDPIDDDAPASYRLSVGWTIYYRGRFSTALGPEQTKSFQTHVRSTPRLSAGSEPYRPELASDARSFQGFSKIAASARPAEDYASIVEALRRLTELLPGSEVEVHDDYALLEWTPLHAIDLDALRDTMAADDGGFEERRRKRSREYRDEVKKQIAALLSEPEYANLSQAARKTLIAKLSAELTEEADREARFEDYPED